MRRRCRRSLNPLSSTTTMVRPSLWVFFKFWPALLFPAPHRGFVSFAGPARRSLATPSQLPQDPPNMSWMVANSALALDQLLHPRRSPQTTGVPQRFRSALQPALNAPQLACS